MTSVSVGPLLGQLLAFQFARWLDNIAGHNKLLLEAGAHQGQLANDILTHLAEYEPDLYRDLHYGILEPSDVRRGWQEETLKNHSEKIRWFKDWDAIPIGFLGGVVFSNELLDAFPVHRLGWDASDSQWFEWGVCLADEEFAWARMDFFDEELLNCLGMDIPAEVSRVLPDGFALEVSPEAAQWWNSAAERLREGYLMTLDYGCDAMHFLKPERTDGTLRSYRHHAVSRNLLECPGEADITAHVNFSTLRQTGNAQGLLTGSYESQAQFLTRIAARTWEGGISFPSWSASMKRQFQTLSHPDHFGMLFKVLVQERLKSSTSL